ncbi:MAG TPA: SGNH/GDSL hydrolase family protein [Flexivirga sp.]|uniref:SGNH/GDSL hydrolase family protein n=1 Tax=Flexivirga sp. TaxID=1962927 RepID=UPI002B9E76F7|nr:SGNH/GDSL hydrolase family protein [Flexivirga sp.]HWC23508.1 SGNH/GDSL hydrolase family protein [Flexivirga sp.]
MRRQLTLVVVVAAAAATVALPAESANAMPVESATAAPIGPAHGNAPAPKWYLALGDSLAAGYQPGTGDDKTGGYVGGALAMLKQQNKSVKLTNLACSGETTTTFTTGTRCPAERSQQDQALHFLKGHRNQAGVITIDLGSNDIDTCVKGGAIDQTCIAGGLQSVSANLPPILQKLHAAAPNARIVVLNYYNPFLAAYLLGPAGQTVAQQSAFLATIFNGEISQAAATINAPIADVAAAFESDDWAPVSTPSFGVLPTNVARICEWTWMCTKQNIHANDAGYAVMASALAPYLTS